MVTRARGKRDELAAAGTETADGDERVATMAHAGQADDICFPMLLGGTSVGALGLSSTPPLTDHEHGVADVDDLSGIIERHGDLCGDAVLTAVGQRVKGALRGSDVKCRYGAEAFLVILPDTPMNGALRVAETLAREVEREVVSWDGTQVPVSASFGVATIRTGEVDPTAALARANDSLQRAKQQRLGDDAEAEYIAVPA
jgi:diguanylate cyclase (GGDEF)-like protein